MTYFVLWLTGWHALAATFLLTLPHTSMTVLAMEAS